MKQITVNRTTALGDVITTTLVMDGDKFVREEITVTGPPELIEFRRTGGSGPGRDVYDRAEKPRRQIWHSPGRYP